MQTDYAISIRQPWVWAIFNLGKDIENRSWSTRFRGRVLIHAAKGMTADEFDDACDLFDDVTAPDAQGFMQRRARISDEAMRGGIVGSVEIVDCVQASASPWFFGRYGFVLRDPQRLPFTPCRGKLGFFLPEFEAPR